MRKRNSDLSVPRAGEVVRGTKMGHMAIGLALIVLALTLAACGATTGPVGESITLPTELPTMLAAKPATQTETTQKPASPTATKLVPATTTKPPTESAVATATNPASVTATEPVAATAAVTATMPPPTATATTPPTETPTATATTPPTEMPTEPAPGSAEAEAIAANLPSDIDITLYQGSDLLGGQRVKFSEVLAQGKPVVLLMWAGL